MAMLKASRRFVSATKRSAGDILPVARACVIPAGARQAIETEHLFGFTIGSDVGDVGERELEGSVTGRFSKQTGTYNAGSGTMSMEFVPIPNLRTEFTGAGQLLRHLRRERVRRSALYRVWRVFRRHPLPIARSRVRAVRLCDRRRAALGPGRRHHRRTGQPVWRRLRRRGRLGDHSRPRRRGIQSDLSARSQRSKLTGIWSQESTAGVAFGVMAQVRPGIFIGGEARYLRQYDGFGLDSLAGQGFFVGPTLYFKLSEARLDDASHGARRLRATQPPSLVRSIWSISNASRRVFCSASISEPHRLRSKRELIASIWRSPSAPSPRSRRSHPP